MADPVRILHLTDLHMRRSLEGTANKPERLSRQMPDRLRDLAGRLDDLGVDLVLVTGDLLDVPDEYIDGSMSDPAERAEMTAQAEADYRRFKDLMDAMGKPYVLIPGNHDDETLFDKVFDGWTPVQDKAGLRFVCFRDFLNSDRTPVRGAANRDLFDRVVGEGGDGPPQIHVQHYMIDPPTWTNLQYHYTDADRYRDRINASGCVAAVLSGHFHPGSHLVSDTGVLYSVPPAFCSAPHPFRLVDIGPDGVLGCEDRSLLNG